MGNALEAGEDFPGPAAKISWRYVRLEEKERHQKEEKGRMTVQEAGRKGGKRTAETHGREFYEKIGHKGGQKVKELIEEGKKARSRSEGR